ncbi:hypothetical protein [Streptomyces sp. NPDC101393]|uniref:hypothetical protein n=1 Tax=Streptomyces sp. NPDC101393 TaxID=3366141 RepID=UPI003812D0B6
MDEYAGRVLAERYRLPLRPAGDDDFTETRAFDTYSGQEVLVRQVPLPEVVDAEVLDAEAAGPGFPGADGIAQVRARTVGAGAGGADRSPRDPAVRRAWEAATAAAALPDHPGLDQVFDVFAQDGSLWIVGELVAARPLAALLADRSLSPHRAAEIAADVLAALRALHGHGWLHRNITPRTVLVCDDGRAILTGLAVGAAQEALCGYAPVPGPAVPGGDGPGSDQDGPARSEPPAEGAPEATSTAEPTAEPAAASKGAPEAAADAAPEAEPDDPRRARAGAIAAYRAGARAAAVATESPDGPDDAPVPAPRPAARQVAHDGAWFSPYQDHIGNGSGNGKDQGDANANANGAEAGAAAEPADEPEPEPAGSRPATAPPTAYGRPSAGLAAERARQARLNVIGPVTERWAPEQAGPVHERWQLAPPVGRATDLWAVGVLLFRSVQGHPPYPEDSAAELAQLVCARQPAAAEECGALRPVVESLLRQDPAERPDFEVLCGWLRSLIRTAPEPELGSGVVTVPALERETDPRRLPIVRRRGELVRRGRHKKSRARRERHPAAAPPAAQATAPVEPPPAPAMPPLQRLPKQPKPLRQPKPSRAAAPPKPVRLAKAPKRPTAPRAQREAAGGLYDQAYDQGYDQPFDQAYDPPYEQQLPGQVGVGPAPERGARAPRRPGAGGGPRHLGRLLLGLVLLLLVAAVVYAVMFLPGSGADTESGRKGDGSTGTSTGASGAASPAPSQGPDGGRDGSGNGGSAGTQDPQTTEPAGLDKGFVVRSDPKGFQVGVRKDWQRRGANDRGQVRYVGGDYELVIVPGRDTTAHFGADPMAYQQNKESELAPYRDSSWSSASGLRRIDVGKTAMAEGTFTWRDGSGREVYVRNLAMIHNGRYHLVLVIGPDNDRREIDHLYEQATDSYRPN